MSLSRSARASFIAAAVVVAFALALWIVLPADRRIEVIFYLPIGAGIIAFILTIPGLMGHLRNVRWAFAAMLPVNLMAAVFLGLLLFSAELRREIGLHLALFLGVDLAGVALLGLSVAGPRPWRPRARRWAMLGAALGCGAFVLGFVLAIAVALS